MNAFTMDCPKLFFGIIVHFLFKHFKLPHAATFSLYITRTVMYLYKLQVKKRFQNLAQLLELYKAD